MEDLNGLRFTLASTAVQYVLARYPRAYMLRDTCGDKTIHVWATRADFADNHPADAKIYYSEG